MLARAARAGVLDLLSRTAQGAANQARGSSNLVAQHRVRPARMLYGDKKVVREYLHAEAAAHDVLADFRTGKHRREPLAYCTDLVPRPRGLIADVAILTDKRLLLAVWATKRVVRHIRLDDVEHFEPSPEGGGTELLLTTRQEQWQVTVSDTQRQMRACMRTQRSRPPDDSPTRADARPARAVQRIQVHRLQCTSKVECQAFMQQLDRAIALFASKAPAQRGKRTSHAGAAAGSDALRRAGGGSRGLA